MLHSCLLQFRLVLHPGNHSRLLQFHLVLHLGIPFIACKFIILHLFSNLGNLFLTLYLSMLDPFLACNLGNPFLAYNLSVMDINSI